MKCRARFAAKMIVLGLVASVTSGCEKKFCVAGLDIGTTYLVTVLEPADANSQYGVQTSHGADVGVAVAGTPSCGAGFDFVAGSAFFAKPIARQDLMDCYGRIGDISGIQEVQILRQMDGLSSSTGNVLGNVLTTQPYEIQRADCTGDWQLGLESPRQESPWKAPVPGEYPPLLLERTFGPSTSTDLQSCLLSDSKLTEYGYCMDYFVVKLDKT
jgi:hypothetical protein